MSNKGCWLLEARNIVKRFGLITALRNVDLKVGYAEVVGLLGDNGAGKSTLIKIISGVYTPDEGQLLWEGQPMQLRSPKDAMKIGISTVYQDLAIVDTISIFRNLFLGREEYVCARKGPIRLFQIDKAKKESKLALENTGIHIRSIEEPAAKLSGGERQSIAIARSIYFDAKLLVLDEPTSALGLKEASNVLKYIERVREKGVSVIFITHNIHHVYPIGDRFTILSHGFSTGSFKKGEKTIAEISELIVKGMDETSGKKGTIGGGSFLAS